LKTSHPATEKIPPILKGREVKRAIMYKKEQNFQRHYFTCGNGAYEAFHLPVRINQIEVVKF